MDALPYIDEGYDDPGTREAVFTLIEEETKRYQPTKNYLEHLPPLDLTQFETELMKKEMERIASGQRMQLLSMKRYELPDPPSNRLTDVAAWQEAVDNSQAQLEHQLNRISNLQLMSTYAAESWKVYNTILCRLTEEAQKQLNSLKKQIQEINWQRKTVQTATGNKIKTLEKTWISLVEKNFEIERTCILLSQEIEGLENRIAEKQVVNGNGSSTPNDTPGDSR
jgi:pre-mRNA-splicing factor SPF27